MIVSLNLQYDLSASQFSPDGRVFQVEYAQKAVENSGLAIPWYTMIYVDHLTIQYNSMNRLDRTVIALRGKDGVVLAAEKLVGSKLYEKGANKRIFNVDRHIGVAVAGLLADARAIVENAREEAKNYRSEYGSPIPITVCNRLLAFRIVTHDSIGPKVLERADSHVFARLYSVQRFEAFWMQSSGGLSRPNRWTTTLLSRPVRSFMGSFCYRTEEIQLICICRAIMVVLLERPNRRLKLNSKNSN